MLKKLLDTLENPSASKKDKEEALRRIREMERATGLPIYGRYNSRNPSELARQEEEDLPDLLGEGMN